jgi:hypothetical protein
MLPGGADVVVNRTFGQNGCCRARTLGPLLGDDLTFAESENGQIDWMCRVLLLARNLVIVASEQVT